jgi:glycosyltransferase involved in cell wall biosynthesis
MSDAPPFTIAVVIPVYNGEAFLKEAVDSALTQTTMPSEICITDDACTDSTPQIIAGYGQRARSQRLADRLPAPGAWNAAVRSCTATHLVILAHDDILEPEFCQAAGEVLERHPDLDLLAFGHRDITADGELRAEHSMTQTGLPVNGILDPSAYLDRFCSGGQFFLPSAVVMSRRIFDLLGGFDPQLKVAYDWDFYLRAGAAGAKILVHERVLCRYRLHPAQSVQGFTRGDNGDNSIIFQKLAELRKSMTDRHIRMVADGMCNFMRHTVSRAVRDFRTPVDQVLELRRSVIETMQSWRSSPLPQAAYIRISPTHFMKRVAWELTGTRTGIRLLRTVLNAKSK